MCNAMEEGISDGTVVAMFDREKHHAREMLNVAEAFQNDLEEIGSRIKQLEDNIRFKKAQKSKLEEAIIDLQAEHGKYTAYEKVQPKDGHPNQDVEAVKQQIIVQHGNSAAGILLKSQNAGSMLNDPPNLAVLGVVATLGKFKDPNLGRVISDFLGIETMLAIVCTSYQGVSYLEATLGNASDGRFSVICLSDLSSHIGNFVKDDPQRRIDLVKPRFPDGDFPPGFLGFAVNMVCIDPEMLVSVRGYQFGLRETLFYHLFSHLQIYETRESMMNALPCISGGAVSLDGAFVKSSGVFAPCTWDDLSPENSRSARVSFSVEHAEDVCFVRSASEKEINEKIRIRKSILEDMIKETELLRNSKLRFEEKKLEFLEFLASCSLYATKLREDIPPARIPQRQVSAIATERRRGSNADVVRAAAGYLHRVAFDEAADVEGAEISGGSGDRKCSELRAADVILTDRELLPHAMDVGP